MASNHYWDATTSGVSDSLLIPDIPITFRYLTANVKALLGNAHWNFPTSTNNTGAWHLPGSAVCLTGTTRQTARPDGTTFDSTNDNGRLFYDTANDVLEVLSDYSGPTWKSFAGLTSSPTWTGTHTFENEPTLPTGGGGLSPVGSMSMYAGATAPTGWLLCDGSLLDNTSGTYDALWTVIGTTYGGTGQTSFKVPDLRGRAPIGVGTGTGLTARALGQEYGAEETTLTSAQSGLPAHSHPADVQYNNPDPSPLLFSGCSATADTGTANTNNNTAQDASEAHTNMQPSLAINFIIKY